MIRGRLIWNTNRKWLAADRSSDMNESGVRSRNFQLDLYNYTRIVWPRITVFGVLIQVEISIHLGFSHVAIFGGRSSVLEFVGPHTYAQAVWPRATTFGTTHVGKARVSGVIRPQIPRRRGPSVLDFFGSPMYAKTVWPRTTKLGSPSDPNLRPSGLIEGDHIWYSSTWCSSVSIWVSHASVPRGQEQPPRNVFAPDPRLNCLP